MPRRCLKSAGQILRAASFFVLIACLLTGCHRGGPAGWNGLNLAHGEIIRVENYAVRGQNTIIDFYSDDCSACMQIGPDLERLDLERDDITLVKVDVDRPGTNGIDWESPLARHYGLDSLPHLKVFDPEGRLSAEGDAARALVEGWM